MRGGDFTRFSKAVASAKGMPSRLLFPIGVHHVNQLLELGDLTLTNTEPDDDHRWYGDVYAPKRARPAPDLRRAVGLGHGVSSHVPKHLRLPHLQKETGYREKRAVSTGRERRFYATPLLRGPSRAGGGRRLFERRRARQQVTNAVLDTLKLIGVDTCHYSGISIRRGGISAGLAARVPEPILFLQSGHASNCAARNYMLPRDPHVLFETYLAFGLGL